MFYNACKNVTLLNLLGSKLHIYKYLKFSVAKLSLLYDFKTENLIKIK